MIPPKKSLSADVYRFHDMVAVTIGSNPPVYLNEKTARALSKAILSCAQDIRKCKKFSSSQFKTINM